MQQCDDAKTAAALQHLELEEAVSEGRQDVGLHCLFRQQDLLGSQVLLGEVGDD